MEASRIITLYDSRSQSIELLCWRLGCGACGRQLPFANRMHDFNPCNRTAGTPERHEPEHGTREPFHCSMVLLHEVIEIFPVADNDSRLVRLVVMPNGCRFLPTPP